jgi:rhodanese-related sulfurtransferase
MPVVSHGVDIDAWKEVKIINTDDMKKLYDSKGDFLLINALSPIEYAEEHISGSTNIPYMYLKSGKVKLPDDKNKMLVFYCKGVK